MLEWKNGREDDDDDEAYDEWATVTDVPVYRLE